MYLNPSGWFTHIALVTSTYTDRLRIFVILTLLPLLPSEYTAAILALKYKKHHSLSYQQLRTCLTLIILYLTSNWEDNKECISLEGGLDAVVSDNTTMLDKNHLPPDSCAALFNAFNLDSSVGPTGPNGFPAIVLVSSVDFTMLQNYTPEDITYI